MTHVDVESLLALPTRAPDAEVPYGSEPSQCVSLWHADRAGAPAPGPVVVLLHGGCWLAEYGLDHVAPLATELSDAGFAVWTPEYRRLGEPGAGWPGTFEDVARAVDGLAEHDDPALDRDRVVLVGHSAGGHLALWAAVRGALGPSDPLYRAEPLIPRAVVGLAAITDLATYAAGSGICQRAVARLMGGAPDEVGERYRLASPASLPPRVPTVLIHGAADRIVPPSQARALPTARVQLLDGVGHFDLIHPGTSTFGVLLERLRELLGDA